MTRCSLRPFERLRNLRERLLASHALENAHIVFRPRSPNWRRFSMCCCLSHNCSYSSVYSTSGVMHDLQRLATFASIANICCAFSRIELGLLARRRVDRVLRCFVSAEISAMSFGRDPRMLDLDQIQNTARLLAHQRLSSTVIDPTKDMRPGNESEAYPLQAEVNRQLSKSGLSSRFAASWCWAQGSG